MTATESDDGPAVTPSAKAAPIPTTATSVALQPPDLSDIATAQKLGTFTYTANTDGTINEDPAWVRAHITTTSVPLLGPVTCNKLMFPQLVGALTELQAEGLASVFDPAEVAARENRCFQPRFANNDPALGLSYHAWGIAIDLNPILNPEGGASHQDPRLVAVMEQWGFEWGGIWALPDPMHFELKVLELPTWKAPEQTTMTVAAAQGGSGEVPNTVAAPPQPLSVTGSASTAGEVAGPSVSATAIVAGGVGVQGGTLNFLLYGAGDATCTQAPIAAASQPVSGGGAYASGQLAAGGPGTYEWVFTYSGDANNQPVTSLCGDDPVHIEP